MIVDCAAYVRGVRRAGPSTGLGAGVLTPAEACALSREPGTFVWIGLHEPTAEEFESVRREFSLHELAVEDAVHAHQRPKLEAYGDSLFVVLKTARYVDPTEVIDFGEILLFVGKNFIISVRHGAGSALADVRRQVEARPDLLKRGPTAILHTIVDRVVDDYRPACEGIERDIEGLEEQVFLKQTRDASERIYFLKREVLDFHHATYSLLPPLTALSGGEYDMVPADIRAFFRDACDHLQRIILQIDGFRDALTGILQANLARVTVRQNEDMRKISAWVAIIAVPTMIAGIYGMNFKFMPELDWPFGYPLAVAIMVIACVALYVSFRKSKWL